MNELIYIVVRVFFTNFVIGAVLGLWIAMIIWVFSFFKRGVK